MDSAFWSPDKGVGEVEDAYRWTHLDLSSTFIIHAHAILISENFHHFIGAGELRMISKIPYLSLAYCPIYHHQ